MAGSPNLKVYNPSGEYVAACKYGEDAAQIVSSYGDGATVRDGHNKKSTVWTEGSEDFSAGESFDSAALLMIQRIDARRAEAHTRRRGAQEDAMRTLSGVATGIMPRP